MLTMRWQLVLQAGLIILALIFVITSYKSKGGYQLYLLHKNDNTALDGYKLQKLRNIAIKLKKNLILAEQKVVLDETDALNWWRIGNYNLTLQNFQDATAAFARAYELQPKNIEFLASYLRSYVKLREGVLDKYGLELTNQLLQLEPGNIVALNCIAVDAFVKGDKNKAFATWSEVKANLAKTKDVEENVALATKVEQMINLVLQQN